MNNSRTTKSLLNARINTVYFLLTVGLSFFTRKIFLDCLGPEFIGMTATLGSVLNFLNITELGVGVAISYSLYKPLAEKNEDTVRQIISILGYIYSRIGFIVLLLAIISSLFFPIWFKETTIPLPLTYFAFFCYLTSSLFSYFLNYPSTVFYADQRGYELSRYTQLAAVLKLLIMAAIAKWVGNFYLYVSTDLIMGFALALIIQYRLKIVYPWLKTQRKDGLQYLKKFPEIVLKTKQIFFHKIGTLVQLQLTPIIVYTFTTFSTVALYANYSLIAGQLTNLLGALMGSSGASIGNLVAEGNRERIARVYKEMLSLRFIVAGYFSFMLYMMIESFIMLWLGDGYILSHAVLVLVVLNLYIGLLRTATDQFILAYGLFQDVWAPAVEATICLTTSLAGGYFWGLAGVLSGNIISLILIVMIWKPYFLFRLGFRCKVWIYWKAFLIRTILFTASVFITIIVDNAWLQIEVSNYLLFILKASALSIVYLSVNLTFLFFFDGGTQDLLGRIRTLIQN